MRGHIDYETMLQLKNINAITLFDRIKRRDGFYIYIKLPDNEDHISRIEAIKELVLTEVFLTEIFLTEIAHKETIIDLWKSLKKLKS